MRTAANILLSLFLLIGVLFGNADGSTCPMPPTQATCYGDRAPDAKEELAARCCCTLDVDDRTADEYEGLTEVRIWRVSAALTAGTSAPWESHPANALLLGPAGLFQPRSLPLYRLKSSYLI